MFGLYQTTIGASVERTVLSEMSKVIALDAEGFSAMFVGASLRAARKGRASSW